MKLCDRSPSFFPVACADVYDRDSCSMVKTRGYCQKFPTSMRTTCGITCNLCGESIYNTIISTICLSLIRQGAITSLSAYLKFVSLRTDSHEGSGTRVNVCEIRVGDRANLREVFSRMWQEDWKQNPRGPPACSHRLPARKVQALPLVSQRLWASARILKLL